MRLPSPAPLLLAASLGLLLLSPAPLPAADTHALSGTLVGPEGRAVPGVPLRGRLRGKGAPLLATRTDAAGRWRLEGLAGGTWILQAGLPGTGVVHQRLVEVPAVGEYPFLIHRGVTKQGRIFDEATGGPAAGEIVFLSSHWHRPNFSCWAWTRTDGEGRWRLEGLTGGGCAGIWFGAGDRAEPQRHGPPGEREDLVIVRRPREGDRDLPPPPEAFPEWQYIGQISRTILRGERSVAGRVLESGSGSPLAGAVVEWLDGIDRGETQFLEWRCVAVTDGEGRFRPSGLNIRGTLRPHPPLHGVVQVPLDRDAPCDDVRIELPPADPAPPPAAPLPPEDPVSPTSPERMIRGRLLDGDGLPAAGVYVEAGTWTLDREGTFLRRDETDAEGRFVLFGMPEGRHDLRVRGDDAHPDQVPGSAERGAQDVLLRMTPYPALEGRVLDLDGAPAIGLEVVAGRRESSARTGEDGRFRIPVRPGWARVEVRCAPDRFAPIRTVVHPAKDLLEIRLRRAGFIRGLVVDLEGNPVAGVRVEVEDVLFGAHKYGDVYYTSERLPEMRKELITDAEGRFVVGGLDPEGSFTVRLSNPRLLPGKVVPEGACRDGIRVDGEEVRLVIPR